MTKKGISERWIYPFCEHSFFHLTIDGFPSMIISVLKIKFKFVV